MMLLTVTTNTEAIAGQHHSSVLFSLKMVSKRALCKAGSQLCHSSIVCVSWCLLEVRGSERQRDRVDRCHSQRTRLSWRQCGHSVDLWSLTWRTSLNSNCLLTCSNIIIHDTRCTITSTTPVYYSSPVTRCTITFTTRQLGGNSVAQWSQAAQ